MKINFFRLSALFLPVLISAQSLTLDDCVKEALSQKETLLSANLNIRSAEQGKKGSYSNVIPSVSLSGGWQESRFPKRTFALDPVTGKPISSVSSTTSISNGISASGTIYDGGRWWNTIAQASNSIIVAKQQTRQTRINVILAVERAFYSQLKAEQLLDVAQKNLDLANSQVELVNQQFKLGSVKKTDLLKAQVKAGQAKMDLLNRQLALKSAKRDLLNTMGRSPESAAISLNEGERNLKPVPEPSLALAALESSNPAYLAIKSLVQDANLSLKLVKGLRLPSLTYRLSYGASTDSLSKLAQAYQDNWSFSGGLTLSFPLFTGFDLSTRVQKAEIAAKQQVYNEQSTIKDLQVQLSTALDGLKSYHDIIPITRDVLQSAEEDLNLAEKRYALGSATILEVLDAQVSVVQARSDVITTLYDAKIQEAQVDALMGVLDKTDY